MTSLFKKLLPFLGFFVVLVVLCSSTPIKENQEIHTKGKIETEETLKGRTILKDGMDFMKDMFDFGSITWVPLGSLIFGNKDDIGFAKWPSKNKN
ncbi:unnamed protein product [Allacma fusca]|uniref:Uncharacterized protein n=1 Tax=Allacma fusca TaxID=39272 RepID=A0A8J2PHF1_9HEXA|nr:unnamed protein product [Allacma fusca]